MSLPPVWVWVSAAPGLATTNVPGTSGPAPQISVKCIILAPACVAGAGVQAATQSAFSDLTQFVADGASWLLTAFTGLLMTTTSVHLDAGWFTTHYTAMVSVAGLLAVAVLLVSAAGVAVTGDAARVTRGVVKVGVGGIATGLLLAITGLLLQLSDSLSTYIAGDSAADLTARLTTVVKGLSPATGYAPDFILLVAAVLAVAIGLLLWLELLVRSVAIYVVVLFFPLAFAGAGFNGSTRWVRRLGETLLAFVFSKFVILAIFSLAAGAIAQSPDFTGVLTGLALLFAAATSPWVLISLLHVAEATAVGAAGSLRGRGASAARAGVGHLGNVGRMASFPGSSRGLTVTRPVGASATGMGGAGAGGFGGAAAGGAAFGAVTAGVGVAAGLAAKTATAPGQHLATAAGPTASPAGSGETGPVPLPPVLPPSGGAAAGPAGSTGFGPPPPGAEPAPSVPPTAPSPAGLSPVALKPYAGPIDPAAESAARAELFRLAHGNTASLATSPGPGMGDRI